MRHCVIAIVPEVNSYPSSVPSANVTSFPTIYITSSERIMSSTPHFGERSPVPPTPSSPSPTPSLQAQHPTLHAATNDYRGGYRSFLNVIFDAELAYDGARRCILQGLTTVDFDNLRQTCRSIDYCLMMPSASGHLRYPPDLIDKCHEVGLPMPPPGGSCLNPPQGTVRIRACQFHDHYDLRYVNPHQKITTHPKEHLVCEVCRRNSHFGMMSINPMNRHDYWRVLLARGHVTLCSLCDREKKRQYYPEGHDGCVCYQEFYKKRWLCRRCDFQNDTNVSSDISDLTSRRRKLRQVGNQMRVMPVDQGPANLPQWLSWCPCGRQVSEGAPPSIQTAPTPWPGHHNVIGVSLDRDTFRSRQVTQQCVRCCGYIVPPAPTARQPTRRSARLADRKSGRQNDRQHTMLGRNGKAATRHGVNRKGFEVRGRGGWV